MWRSPCSPCFPSSAASRPSSSMFPCFLEIHKFVVFPIWGNCVSLTNWMRTGFAPLWPVTQLNGKLSDELPERLLSINCSGFLLQNRCTFTFTDTDSNQEIKICGVKMRQEWNNHNQCKLSAVNIVKTVKKITWRSRGCSSCKVGRGQTSLLPDPCWNVTIERTHLYF